MRFGIDASCWSNERGFGRYTRELVTWLLAERGENEFVLVVDQATAQQCQFPDDAVLKVVHTSVRPTAAASADGSRSLGDMWKMSRAATGGKFDLFYFPAVYSYYPLFSRMPTIVTFHDAIAEQFPDLIFPSRRSRLFWNLKTKLALRQARRLLTVSENAKTQIIEAFNYPASDISVVLEGSGAEFQMIDDRERLRAARQQYQLPHDVPLILYVGGISPHKNLDGLLRALAGLNQSDSPPWHLALVGDYKNDSFYGCYDELVKLRGKLGLDDRVTFTGYVSNADLVAIYNDASVLVLPSFSEGFGLPVVEAMACGLPVAASNRGSLPEVVADAGLLFDPDQPDEIASVVGQLLADPALREQLRDRGLARAKQFSWKSAARQAIKLFEDTARDATATP